MPLINHCCSFGWLIEINLSWKFNLVSYIYQTVSTSIKSGGMSQRWRAKHWWMIGCFRTSISSDFPCHEFVMIPGARGSSTFASLPENLSQFGFYVSVSQHIAFLSLLVYPFTVYSEELFIELQYHSCKKTYIDKSSLELENVKVACPT